MHQRHPLHCPWLAPSVSNRNLVVFPLSPVPTLFGGEELPIQGRLHATHTVIVDRVEQSSPPYCAGHGTSGGSCGRFIERQAYSILRTAAHAPPGRAPLAIPQLPATWEPCPPYVCSNVSIGGSVLTSAPDGGYVTASSNNHGNRRDRRFGGPPSRCT